MVISECDATKLIVNLPVVLIYLHVEIIYSDMKAFNCLDLTVLISALVNFLTTRRKEKIEF